MAFTGDYLRRIMRRYPTDVSVVTTAYRGAFYGLTANSFISLSLNPPLVLVAIDKRARTHEAVKGSGVYAVNILAHDMEEIARRFATAPPEERFRDLKLAFAATGVPILADALAYLDCEVVAEYPGGDHTIFVGRVVDGAVLNDKPPLIYYDRGYRSL
ncbi:flavin reductase [Thermoproteus uzoniensis 768-20]|uniref:Flavin reductase n=1 Tax=Thermoproteus uzoniensis (strain 768-20) TaxID=999630 RepID=F2L6A8_THEU7|nr:flavin reductase family protein [Thermoproteus uzoniensis]AEA12504.1 flavin reductase [Thermoproteus uzoniensis 768-20]